MLTSEIMMFGSKAQLKSVIYNNIGCLKYLMGNYRSSLNYFEDAKALTLNSSLISHFNHNIAITNEKLDKFSEAIAIYQEILRSDPSQIVCDLRL
ncbi:MAG: protein required for normal CLN1 and CLN2 G1 cyclin expression, partial [Paramarteilia canceri]